jgi:hypothetical protein
MKKLTKLLPLLTAVRLVLLVAWLAPSGLAQSIPAGTEIKVRLLDQLDTGETQAGQIFSATIAEPVRSGGRTVLARGTTVKGRVTDVVSSGRLKRPASITLELTRIGGTNMQAEALQLDGKSHAVRNVALIGGGAAAGAILGGVAAGGKGAAIGTAVGAGAGTATAYLTGKQELVLPVETLLTFVAAGSPATLRETRAAELESHAVRGSRDERREDADAYDALIFSEHDQRLIRAYFRPRGGRGLPPGLAKRNGNLPPGLEKQMRRNGTLPPGLQKRVEPFPMDLSRRLPRLPGGYSRVIVEGRALILAGDSTIVDLMFIFD